MKLEIMRFDGKRVERYEEFEVGRVATLLEAFYRIKEFEDPTFTFEAECRSGICGACAVRVNGKERLACSHTPMENDRIEPLEYHEVQRDMLVCREDSFEKLTKAGAYLHRYERSVPDTKEERKTEIQSDCILCESCYSACPVLAIDGSFLGPFALSRAYRYADDSREGAKEEIVASVQNSGVWDCTLCGECTAVCPQGIDPKGDILALRTLSLQSGYSDPNFATLSFSTPDFSF